MGITTKAGDEGRTELRKGLRVAKDHPRVEACGEVDELSSVLGLARLACRGAETAEALESVQRDLVRVAGELASLGAPPPRPLLEADVESIGGKVRELEARIPIRGFVLPGRTEASARIDLARAVARRLERRVVSLSRGSEPSAVLLRYLNRLSDYLFMLARAEEASEGKIEYA